MDISSFFRSMKLIYGALIASSTLIAAAGIALFYLDIAPFISKVDPLNDLLGYIVIAISLMSVPAGFFFFKMIAFRNRKNPEFSTKLTTYRLAFIMRMVVFESASALAFISFILTGRMIDLTLGAFLIGFMLIMRPSETELKDEFNLSQEEFMRLEAVQSATGR